MTAEQPPGAGKAKQAGAESNSPGIGIAGIELILAEDEKQPRQVSDHGGYSEQRQGQQVAFGIGARQQSKLHQT